MLGNCVVVVAISCALLRHSKLIEHHLKWLAQ